MTGSRRICCRKKFCWWFQNSVQVNSKCLKHHSYISKVYISLLLDIFLCIWQLVRIPFLNLLYRLGYIYSLSFMFMFLPSYRSFGHFSQVWMTLLLTTSSTISASKYVLCFPFWNIGTALGNVVDCVAEGAEKECCLHFKLSTEHSPNCLVATVKKLILHNPKWLSHLFL